MNHGLSCLTTKQPDRMRTMGAGGDELEYRCSNCGEAFRAGDGSVKEHAMKTKLRTPDHDPQDAAAGLPPRTEVYSGARSRVGDRGESCHTSPESMRPQHPEHCKRGCTQSSFGRSGQGGDSAICGRRVVVHCPSATSRATSSRVPMGCNRGRSSVDRSRARASPEPAWQLKRVVCRLYRCRQFLWRRRRKS